MKTLTEKTWLFPASPTPSPTPITNRLPDDRRMKIPPRLVRRRLGLRLGLGLALAMVLAVLRPIPTAAAVAEGQSGYTAPGLGSRLTDPTELSLENFQILQESALAGHRTLVEVSADLRLLGSGEWVDARARARADSAIRYLTSYIQGGPGPGIGELGTNSPATPAISVIVAAAEVAPATAEVLSGTVLRTTAMTLSGAIIDDPTQLPLENIELINQVTLADGRVLLQFDLRMRNLTAEPLQSYSINFARENGAVTYDLPGASLQYADGFTFGSSAHPLSELLLDIDSTQLDAIRPGLLSGFRLTVTGTELWVFNAPPRGIDAATEDAWRPPAESVGAGQLRLVFTNATDFLTSLHPGDLLVEDRNIHPMQTEAPDNPADPFDDDDKVLANYLPFQIATVTVLSNRVEVVGEQKALLEVIRSATFVANSIDAYRAPVRDPYNPVLENTYTHKESTNRATLAKTIEAEDPMDGRLADLKGMVGTPWHFNETFLSDKIKVSGEMFFRQSGLQIEMKIREFQLQRAAARIDAGVVLNLVIEATGAENTSNKLAFEKSKDLLPEILKKLPAVHLSLGGVPVTLQPELSFLAGVEANIPTSLTLPLQSAFTVGLQMGYDRDLVSATSDGYFYAPITELIPLRVSDPTVFDEFAAELGAWAEVGVALKVGVGEGASLRAGPTLAVRLANNFRLAPLDNPWWELDSGLDLIGRFQLEADFLGLESFQLFDAETSLDHFNLFHRDAGGPLIPADGLQLASVQSSTGIEPLIGKNVRWGRLLAPGGAGTWGGWENPVLLRLGTNNDLLVAGVGTISRFSAKGDLIWARNLGPYGEPQRGVVLPDGSFTLVGTRFSELWMANFSAAGERTWWTTFAPTGGLAIQNLVLGSNAQGDPEYYLVGHVQRALVTRSDPEVIKFDAAGQVLWANSYDLSGKDDEAHGAVLTAHGDLVVSGRTGHPVQPPAVGTPDAGNVLKSGCGLLMKISGVDGSIVWARNYPSQWGLDFYRVLEAPDGTLIAAGSAGRIVTQTRPSSLFARFRPDGTLIDHVTIGEDADWPDELPNAGNTPYDFVHDMIWTPEGLWACGVTGLGTGTAGWVMGLTEELGVRFYSVIDGPKYDECLRLVDAGDGLAVLGNTYSSYPWGVGDLPVPILLKLPWEGLMRFHPDAQLQSRFLQPRVYKSSSDLEFLITSRLSSPGAPPQVFYAPSGTVPFTTAPVEIRPGGPLPAPTLWPNYLTYALEAVNTDRIRDYPSWAAYHQMSGVAADPSADGDQDGLANYLEAYFGRNPFQRESASVFNIAPALSNGQAVTVIEYDRSPFAASFTVRVESSTDLQHWTTATDLSSTVTAIDSRKERVRLTVPSTGPARYFRVRGL
jgi:hypothetical protein